MKVKHLTLILFTYLSFQINPQTVTDIDGNIYPVVTIGNQQWMASNLRASHFSDGSPLTDAGFNNWYFSPLSEPRFCFPIIPPNTTDTFALGYWYNYPAAADTRNICPQGWRVATDADWHTLVKFLDPIADTSSITTLESEIAGGFLKDTVMWISPNIGATNSTGFSVLPVSSIAGSIVWPAGHVCCQGLNASFWCGGPAWNPGVICYDRSFDYMQANSVRNTDNYTNGKSIRCVCDTLSTASHNEIELIDKFSLYPNPSSNSITLISLNGEIGNYSIFNAFGILVYEGNTAQKTLNIDVSFLEDGIYIIYLFEKQESLKWVKKMN